MTEATSPYLNLPRRSLAEVISRRYTADSKEHTMGTKDETYNGWPNYETWNVNLWLSNDEGSYHMAREIARACKSDLAAGEAIKEWLESDDSPWPTPTTGLLADLLGHAFQRVDWQKIGESFREE